MHFVGLPGLALLDAGVSYSLSVGEEPDEVLFRHDVRFSLILDVVGKHFHEMTN